MLQNLAPGAAARLGLSYATLSKKNPRIVVCDISGYGESGPYAQKKAYDLLVQAESGLISINGTPDTPARVGISVADVATGMYAQSAILAALLRRERTGKGAEIKIAMLDALTEWVMYAILRGAYTGKAPPRDATSHPLIAPYGAHRSQDGSVIFGIQNEREWATFCQKVLGKPELVTDPRFADNNARRDNREALTGEIEAVFTQMPSVEVVRRLDEAGVANGRLNDVFDVWKHPALEARNRWRDIEIPGHTVRAMLPPFDVSEMEPRMDAVPALGADTDSILADLGFDAERISALRKAGAV